MHEIIRLVGASQVVELFGIRLVGVSAESGAKPLISLVFIAVVVLISRLAQRFITQRTNAREGTRALPRA